MRDVQYQDALVHIGDTDTRIRFPADDTVSVETGGSEAARFDSNGRLQIGSSTLTNYNEFSGVGRLNIQNNSADGTVDFSQGIVFTDNVNNQGTWTHAGIVATGSAGYNGNLIFGTDNTGDRGNSALGITEKMRITNDGKVGIGTNNPNYNVESYGTDASIIAHYPNESRGGIAAFENQKIALVTTNANDNLVFGSSNPLSTANFVERMRIDNGTGNVGIASDSPTSTLDVIGDFTVKRDNNIDILFSSTQNLNEHVYSVTPNGVTIKSNEARLDLIAEGSGTHAGSFLIRDNSHDGFGFVNDFTNKELQLKSFTSSGNYFSINSTGSNGNVL